MPVADLEGGGPAGSPPPPERRTNAVTVHLISDRILTNDCHKWLSHSFRMHQIRFRPELHPYPTGRTYRIPPVPLAGLRGDPTTKGKGRTVEGKGGERRRQEGRGGEGKGRDRGRPP